MNSYNYKLHNEMYDLAPVALRKARENGQDLERSLHYFHNLIMDIASYRQVDADATGAEEQFNEIVK